MREVTADPSEATRRAVYEAGLPKATGEARFASDIHIPGELHARVVRSPLPHCTINRVDVKRALEVPGVRTVLTAADIPGLNRVGKTVFDQPILAETRARSVLDAIALVAADDAASAQAGAEAVSLHLDALPGVFSVDEALAADSQKVHSGGNLLRQYHLVKGDVDQGFAEADIVIDGEYSTSPIEHAYMEPDCAVAAPNERGGLTIWTGCHSVASERELAARVCALPEKDVTVIQPYMGGSFGGKDDGLLTAYVALLAQATKQPVRLAFDRRELFRSHTKGHAFHIHVRTGCRRSGELTAASYEIVTDTGAYAHWGESLSLFASIGAAGPYRIPHVRVDMSVVYTNNVPMGAMRAWGMPAVNFATESQLDRLARELGMDPITIRLMNAVRDGAGDTLVTGQAVPSGIGLSATLRAAAQGLSAECAASGDLQGFAAGGKPE